MAVTVKSGINRVTLELEAGTTIADLYNKCSQVLNLEGNTNLNVVVDGEQYAYSEVSDDGVTDGSIVEFIKKAGSKGF